MHLCRPSLCSVVGHSPAVTHDELTCKHDHREVSVMSHRIASNILILCLCYVLFCPPCDIRSSGKGSDPRCTCNLGCSCGNAGSLAQCAGPGMEPASQCTQDASDLIAPQREPLEASLISIPCCKCLLPLTSQDFFPAGLVHQCKFREFGLRPLNLLFYLMMGVSLSDS